MVRFRAPLFTREMFRPSDFSGMRVTVMGLGLFGGGQGLTEALCRWGARVTVTDLADEKRLAPTISALEGLPIRLVLSEHREEDFLSADLVFVNPAVPRNAPLLGLCQRRGIPLETEMNLFFKLCPGRIWGVTGSNGKTTTTLMIQEMVKGELPGTRCGGNLGRSLLGKVEETGTEDWTILELSSFQLEDLTAIDRRPDGALITNLSPNHLDRHGSYESYCETKRVILEPAGTESWAVLSGDDPRVRNWGAGARRRVVYYGRSSDILPRAPGVWVTPGGEVVASGVGPGERGSAEMLFSVESLRLRGRFNLVNAAGAATVALVMGVSPAALEVGARRFRPVQQRLELVHNDNGVEYYNDSISTTPTSTICALETLGPRVILIAGGSEKGSSFAELGRVIARQVRSAVLIGQTAPAIERAIQRARPVVQIHREDSLEEAVGRARSLARPGERVVLSPASASYDMFTNFQERGERFNSLARKTQEAKSGTGTGKGANPT